MDAVVALGKLIGERACREAWSPELLVPGPRHLATFLTVVQ